jgi:DNA polymerase III delta prime subunit
MTPKIDKLGFHSKTQKQAQYFLRNPNGSLLILGGGGAGKAELAIAMSACLLETENLSNEPNFLAVTKPNDKQEISIDGIRQVAKFLKLKVPGDGQVRRVILVTNAHDMSMEAQNSLLKMLEEPNPDTVFILTAPYELSLLPTIVSRCQIIQVHPLTSRKALEHYGAEYQASRINSAWRLSQGNKALLEALLKEDDSHPLKQAVEQVKQFLKSSRYERQRLLEKYLKDRRDLGLFLEALSKVLTALHHTSVLKNDVTSSQALLSDRRAVRRAHEALTVNANVKLTTLGLLHNLKT